MKPIIFVCVILMAGCAELDRPMLSAFSPMPDGSFQFRAKEQFIYSHEDRMTWLDQYIADNNICPNGYRIDSSQIISAGFSSELFVTGRCYEEEQTL